VYYPANPIPAADKESNYYKYDQYGDNPMPQIGPVGIIAMKGTRSFTEEVNSYLVERRRAYLETEPDQVDIPGFLRDDYHIPVNMFRFSSGEGKAVIESTVRGHDLYIISDITNYEETYKLRGHVNHMSPDDHYQDLKRVILAASGKARRINIIMPYLYEGRQHRRHARESLDCAYMLEELEGLGMANFITFDAHDDRVANAIPTSGFESIPTTYQVLKAMVRHENNLSLTHDRLMIVSPDEGAIMRAMYYASILGVPLGTFYKRRDYTIIRNGRNPIVAHEFLGDSVEGYDIIIVDDMISSGDSMLDLARQLKARNAGRIFCVATFGLFTDGISRFNEAYEEGLIASVYCTNLIYRSKELLAAPWYVDVSMSKFVALIIDAINHNASFSTLIDPSAKIRKLLARSTGQG
jgi:ribose-phosphate pyrophosphokinase